ncbi:DNA repair protein RecO [uncultured Prevotella sp.]|uniref:DNA repair protein RecO n=1 Tax=uncultured Prevotella sp. TaxID=159272 RepID=UPI0028049455|nr:DNA repair protein RecO [uncultured Prevotella sp.]
MLQKTKAIVLHSLKYGDSSLIIDLLTEEEGRLTFIVRLPKTPKGKIKKQYFQPMTLLDIAFDFRPHASMQRIKDIRIDIPFTTIPFDPIKSSILLFISEFLLYITRSEQYNKALYQFVAKSVEWLDTATDHFANFHLTFMLHLSKFIGFHPNLSEATPYAFFDLRNAEFCHQIPLHTDYLKPNEANIVLKLFRMNYESMHLFRFSREERNYITEIILRYYTLHIPSMPTLNSFAILKEIFE